MAIDFSQVNTITIPEGSVKKITDSTGVVIWKEKPNNWHTIWEGNKTCSVKVNGSSTPVITGSENNFAQTVSGTGYTPKIRITFSYSRTNNSPSSYENAFIVNNSWKYSNEADQTSPITIESVYDSTNSANLCAPACDHIGSDTAYGYAGIRKKRDTENNRIIFNMYPNVSSNITSYNGNFIITFTVTKIEQYIDN